MKYLAHVASMAMIIATVPATFLGPTYPAPVDLSSQESLVRSAWEELTSRFDTSLKQGGNVTASTTIAGAEGITFSAGLFSLHDEGATKLQYHYTAPQIAESPYGTNEVDGDSIYRVASVSKLVTVFSALLSLSEEQWNRAITDFVPELISHLNDDQSPHWSEITPSMLASQLSGIAALGTIGDLYLNLEPAALAANTSIAGFAQSRGLPPPHPSRLAPASGTKDYTTRNFMALNGWEPPTFLPNWTPAYSDLGFMILGLVISRVTGKAYDMMYRDLVFERLGMDSSFANAPTGGRLFSRSVIAGPMHNNFQFAENIPTIPSGGLLSTINDLCRLGIGMLNGTLISKKNTRAWMKPRTHTASLTYSVGEPWEIVRYIHRDTGKVTDIYTKLGDSGSYGGMLAIIPDYDAGFSFLNAQFNSSERGQVALKLIDLISEEVIPALEAQAAAEATRNFVGTYESTDPQLDSSLEIAFNESTVLTSSSGLNIQNWISNGTDMIDVYFRGTKPRLLLSVPKESSGPGNVTFQCSTQPQWNNYRSAKSGPFTGFYDSNFGWLTYDGSRWIGGQIDAFTFAMDEQGYACTVKNGATNLLLRRSSDGEDFVR